MRPTGAPAGQVDKVGKVEKNAKRVLKRAHWTVEWTFFLKLGASETQFGRVTWLSKEEKGLSA